ncbi:MAG: GrpB family protein [Planctomycetaceae bacterium]|nr:GrpB family protein [Planctomycetaceae bacterium]
MIEICSYRSSWADDFVQQASALHSALGPLALRVDHIGSTSVPGLAAKDVIDIQVTVEDLSVDLVTQLTGAGFVQHVRVGHDHVPPGFSSDARHWSKLLFLERPGDRRCNIHVRRNGMANQRYPLLFRDYLRAHPATAEAYAVLKRRLAVSLADPKQYPEVKDPAVDLIYLAAEDWAGRTGWQP